MASPGEGTDTVRARAMRPRCGSFRASKERPRPARLAGRESARPGCDSHDAVLEVREGSGGRTRIAAERPLLRPAADRLPDGPVRSRAPYPAGRCRLRRSVGPALPGFVAAQNARCVRVYRMNPSMGDVYKGSRRANASLTCASGEPKTIAFVVFRTCANSFRNPPIICLMCAASASEF